MPGLVAARENQVTHDVPCGHACHVRDAAVRGCTVNGLRSRDTYARGVPRSARAAWAGLGLAIVLATLGMAVPALLDWDVHVRWFPPLHAEWDPRVGWGTLPAVVLGVLAWRNAIDLAVRLSWGRLLLVSYAGGLAWMLALALVDGVGGIGDVLDHPYEYLRTARATDDLPHTIDVYISRIPVDALPSNWPVHIAGHPPGALTFFVLLVRLGLAVVWRPGWWSRSSRRRRRSPCCRRCGYSAPNRMRDWPRPSWSSGRPLSGSACRRTRRSPPGQRGGCARWRWPPYDAASRGPSWPGCCWAGA